MLGPYVLVTFLYFALAVLTALDISLVNFGLLPGFAGLRWIRIHFITLGALTQIAFGMLPVVVALRNKLPRPKMRWDIWLTLNLGILILLAGIPSVSAALITIGGTLVFIATTLLTVHLAQMQSKTGAETPGEGRKFYIAGLVYLLVGIIVGTGLWQNWSAWLQIKVPLEVHIHANNWGFMSLVFAGLLVDLYPGFAGRDLASKRAVTPIFWVMTVGALGLILGPWFKSNLFLVPGLILHLSATIWLLVIVVRPVLGDPLLRTPGMLHLLTSYAWILAPVLVAPFILFGVPGFPGAGIEQNAPQALIYGWVLQFGFAVIPLLFRRSFLPDAPAKLGGNWLSLVAVHLGGLFLWVGIFVDGGRQTLHGIAYSLWFIAMLPIAYEIWLVVQNGMVHSNVESPAVPAVEAGD